MEESVDKTESGKGDVTNAEQDGNDDTTDNLPASKKGKREKSNEKSKPASPKRKKSVEKKDAKDQSKATDNDTNDENENVKNKTKKEESVKNGAGSGIPLITDPRLPVGWMRKVVQRQGGQSAGKFDVYIYSPEGKKFRSRFELQRHFDKTSSSLKIEDFDFTVHGSGNKSVEKKPTKRKAEVKPKKSKSEPAPKKTKSEPATKKTKSKGKKASASKQRLVVKLNFSPKKRALESLKESDTSEAETETKSSKRKKAAAASKTKTSPTKAEAKSSPKSKTRRRR